MELIKCPDCGTEYDGVDYWCCPVCRSRIICAACGKPIEGDDLDDRHWGHEPDCPRRYDPDACGGVCGCDLEYHAACAPDEDDCPVYWEEVPPSPENCTVHSEVIICPQCDAVEVADVLHTVPWYSYVHHCTKCGYIIMESEWQRAEPTTVS